MTEPLSREDVRGLNDATRTLIEQLDRHGISNLALFEQQVGHARGHLFSDAALASDDGREGLAANGWQVPCEFGPAHEPWGCLTHRGGIRTSLAETACSVVRRGALEQSIDAVADALNGWDLGEPPRPDTHRHWVRIVDALSARSLAVPEDAALREADSRAPRSLGSLTADMLRLADAVIDNVAYDADGTDGLCRYCQNLYGADGHAHDCPVVLGRRYRRALTPESGASET